MDSMVHGAILQLGMTLQTHVQCESRLVHQTALQPGYPLVVEDLCRFWHGFQAKIPWLQY
jgi:hypothetical protein